LAKRLAYTAAAIAAAVAVVWSVLNLTDKSNWRGGHEDGYWNEHWSDYLAFYSKALEQC